MADPQNARPDPLQRKIAALAALLAGLWADGSGAPEVLSSRRGDIDAAIGGIAAWVADEFGIPVGTLNAPSVRGRFIGATSQYLDEHKHLSGDEARNYAALTVASELQRLEAALVQQAIRASEPALIERRLGYSASGPCPRCIELAGSHPLDFPDLFWTHPYCVCSWHAAGKAVTSAFAGRGNPQALRDWYDASANGQIHWGTPGDFDRCVEIAGKYISNPQGFCQERHIDATGHPAGHAPGEAKHAMTLSTERDGITLFANWDSQGKRDAEPKSTFCGPGTSFPIKDCSDVSHARSLLHNAKGNQGSISSCIEGKAKTLSCPASSDTGKANHAMTTSAERAVFGGATFAGTSRRIENGMVIRRGKLFEVGEHVPGNSPVPFALSPEEAVLAAGGFAPVAINLGHQSSGSPLDGHLGRLRSMEYHDDGSLHGESEMPEWLDTALTAALGDADVPISLEWDRATKQVSGIALATGQIIPDAALSAAFAASHDTPSGQWAMQQHHDNAARAGAVCKKPANMASKHEADANQQIHDIAAAHGAGCDGSKQGMSGARPAMYAQEKKHMDRNAFLSWLLGKGDEPDTADAVFSETNTEPEKQPEPADTARFAALEQKLAVETAKRVAIEAEAWADKEIRECRSMPAQKQSLIASYAEAVVDDEKNGVAKFADGTEDKTRVQKLIERHAENEPHYLSKEMLPADADGKETATIFAALANEAKTKGVVLASGRAAAQTTIEDPDAYRKTAAYARLAKAFDGDSAPAKSDPLELLREALSK